MNELTTSMKSVCFGRYLVDVPKEAEVALGYARSDSADIKTVESPSKSDHAFQGRLANREEELRLLKHDTEGTRLREAVSTTDGRRVFVYRQDGDGELISIVETIVRKGDHEWYVGHAIADEDVKNMKEEIEEIAQGLSPRDPSGVPAGPGACIRDGLVNRTPKYGEEFAGGARMENLSWTLSFRSETSKPRDKEHRLISRAQDAVGMAGASSGIKVLRKREVTIDGRTGEEFIALYPGNGVVSFDAKLELYGNGTYRVPTIKLNLAANRLSPPDPNDKRVFMSDEEALALWDAMVKSIRPRPGAF